MDRDDPVTGRRMLTDSAYADDRHIRSRLAIFAHAEAPTDPRWRTSFVPWDGTQIVADVGCGSGLDLRQLVPGGGAVTPSGWICLAGCCGLGGGRPACSGASCAELHYRDRRSVPGRRIFQCHVAPPRGDARVSLSAASRWLPQQHPGADRAPCRRAVQLRRRARRHCFPHRAGYPRSGLLPGGQPQRRVCLPLAVTHSDNEPRRYGSSGGIGATRQGIAGAGPGRRADARPS